jgi:hypothetical protein
MKRFLMTVALTCILSMSALAGEIPTVGVAQPPPSGTTQTTSAASPGDIPSTDVAQPTSNALLSFIQAVIGLLI